MFLGIIPKVTGINHEFKITQSLVSGQKLILDCRPGFCKNAVVGAKETKEASKFKDDNDYCGDKIINTKSGFKCKPKSQTQLISDKEPNEPVDFAEDFKSLNDDLKDMNKPEMPGNNPVMRPGTEEKKNFDQKFCQTFPKFCHLY